MFKIVKNPTFTHSVPVMVPVDGGHVEQSLKVKFRVVPQDELADHDLRTPEGTESWCRAVVAEFGDIVGEDNEPLPPSDEVTNTLFRTPYVQVALIRAYALAMAKARAGN
jgi:hypothetical protein